MLIIYKQLFFFGRFRALVYMYKTLDRLREVFLGERLCFFYFLHHIMPKTADWALLNRKRLSLFLSLGGATL